MFSQAHGSGVDESMGSGLDCSGSNPASLSTQPHDLAHV